MIIMDCVKEEHRNLSSPDNLDPKMIARVIDTGNTQSFGERKAKKSHSLGTQMCEYYGTRDELNQELLVGCYQLKQ